MSRPGPRAVAGLLVVGCVALSACGGGDDGASTPQDSPTPSTAAEDAPTEVAPIECPFSAADVGAVIGEEMVAVDQEQVGSGCGFETTADPIAGPQVIWRRQSPLALESFGPDQGGESVAGLGDEAVCLADLGSTSTVVRAGDVVFEVQVISDDAPCDQAVDLAAAAMRSLDG